MARLKLFAAKADPSSAPEPLESVTSAPVKRAVAKPAARARKRSGGGDVELATKIRDWGKKRRLSNDAYLSGLADAIFYFFPMEGAIFQLLYFGEVP